MSSPRPRLGHRSGGHCSRTVVTVGRVLAVGLAAALSFLAQPTGNASAEPVDPARLLASRLGIPVREFPIEVFGERVRTWPPLVSPAMISLDRTALIRTTYAHAPVLREPHDGGDYLPVTYVGVNLLSPP